MKPATAEDSVLRELQALGLGGLQARVYLALLRARNPATGYQVAKTLGVARANVYDALRGLYGQGVVWRQGDAGGVRYRATPFERVAERFRRSLEGRLARLGAELGQGAMPATGIWQGQGWTAFADQVISCLGDGREVIVGASPGPVRILGDALAGLQGGTTTVRFRCFAACPPAGCGTCRDPIARPLHQTVEHPCAVLIDGRQAVVTTGQEGRAAVVATDDPLIVAGLHSLLAPPVTRGGEDDA